MTVKDGVRASTANAYLRPAMKRSNLKVVTQALATRIAFDGRRAIGVRLPAPRPRSRGRRPARGHSLRRGDQFAAVAEALGGRDRRPNSAGSGSRSSPTGQGSAKTCRTISSSPSRSARRSRSRSFPIPACWARAHRRKVDDAGQGPRGVESFRSRRLRPLARRRSVSRHPVPFPPDSGRLRRLDPRPRARLSGACRADAVEKPRLGAPQVARSCSGAENPVQLHEPCRRLDRDARLPAAHARNLRSSRFRPLSGPGNPAGARVRQRRGDRRFRARADRHRLSSLVARARWARPATLLPSSIQRRG